MIDSIRELEVFDLLVPRADARPAAIFVFDLERLLEAVVVLPAVDRRPELEPVDADPVAHLEVEDVPEKRRQVVRGDGPEDEGVVAGVAGQDGGRVPRDEAIVPGPAQHGLETRQHVPADLDARRDAGGEVDMDAFAHRRQVQRVLARSAVVQVVAVARRRRDAVVAASGEHGVPAGPADQDVAAGPAVEEVPSGTAVQGIVAVAAGQGVVAAFAEQAVVPRLAEEDVVAGTAQDDVVAGTREHDVVARAGDDPVVAAAAVHDVVPGAGVDGVAAVTAVDLIVMRRADEDVATVGADDPGTLHDAQARGLRDVVLSVGDVVGEDDLAQHVGRRGVEPAALPWRKHAGRDRQVPDRQGVAVLVGGVREQMVERDQDGLTRDHTVEPDGPAVERGAVAAVGIGVGIGVGIVPRVGVGGAVLDGGTGRRPRAGPPAGTRSGRRGNGARAGGDRGRRGIVPGNSGRADAAMRSVGTGIREAGAARGRRRPARPVRGRRAEAERVEGRRPAGAGRLLLLRGRVAVAARSGQPRRPGWIVRSLRFRPSYRFALRRLRPAGAEDRQEALQVGRDAHQEEGREHRNGGSPLRLL
jgi:hypothetical protein